MTAVFNSACAEIRLLLAQKQSPLPYAEIKVLDRGSGVPRGCEEKVFEKRERDGDEEDDREHGVADPEGPVRGGRPGTCHAGHGHEFRPGVTGKAPFFEGGKGHRDPRQEIGDLGRPGARQRWHQLFGDVCRDFGRQPIFPTQKGEGSSTSGSVGFRGPQAGAQPQQKSPVPNMPQATSPMGDIS